MDRPVGRRPTSVAVSEAGTPLTWASPAQPRHKWQLSRRAARLHRGLPVTLAKQRPLPARPSSTNCARPHPARPAGHPRAACRGPVWFSHTRPTARATYVALSAPAPALASVLRQHTHACFALHRRTRRGQQPEQQMNLARAAPGLSCRPHRRRPRDDVMANSFFPFSPFLSSFTSIA